MELAIQDLRAIAKACDVHIATVRRKLRDLSLTSLLVFAVSQILVVPLFAVADAGYPTPYDTDPSEWNYRTGVPTSGGDAQTLFGVRMDDSQAVLRWCRSSLHRC